MCLLGRGQPRRPESEPPGVLWLPRSHFQSLRLRGAEGKVCAPPWAEQPGRAQAGADSRLRREKCQVPTGRAGGVDGVGTHTHTRRAVLGQAYGAASGSPQVGVLVSIVASHGFRGPHRQCGLRRPDRTVTGQGCGAGVGAGRTTLPQVLGTPGPSCETVSEPVTRFSVLQLSGLGSGMVRTSFIFLWARQDFDLRELLSFKQMYIRKSM